MALIRIAMLIMEKQGFRLEEDEKGGQSPY
jgi:hypothetical protein